MHTILYFYALQMPEVPEDFPTFMSTRDMRVRPGGGNAAGPSNAASSSIHDAPQFQVGPLALSTFPETLT